MTDPDSWDAVDDFKTCAALDGFDAAEREQLIDEANEILGQRYQAQKERSARYYLNLYKDRPYLWYLAIESWPGIEQEFTPEQAALWAIEKAKNEERKAEDRARDERLERMPLKFPERKPQ